MTTDEGEACARTPFGAIDPSRDGFLRSVREYLAREGLESGVDVCVARRGPWFVLDGCVQSQRLKASIIGLVPEVDGHRWVVDRVRVDPRGRARRVGL